MLKQQGITQAGDLYQIGVVLYEMLVGIPPYYNDNIKVLYSNIEKGKLKMPKYLSNEAKKFLLVSSHKFSYILYSVYCTRNQRSDQIYSRSRRMPFLQILIGASWLRERLSHHRDYQRKALWRWGKVSTQTRTPRRIQLAKRMKIW